MSSLLAETAPAEDTLLALWQRARALAMRRCARTLGRLRAGQGGFYEAEDFLQDLFLEFRALLLRWQATGEAEEALWARWRRFLQHGGIRVLHRTPQRLWAGAERAVAAEALALDEEEEAEAPAAALPPPLRAALTQAEDGAATQVALAHLEELEAALWTLRPAARQALYLSALEQLDAAQVARCLGLGERRAVHEHLYAARRALRGQLATR